MGDRRQSAAPRHFAERQTAETGDFHRRSIDLQIFSDGLAFYIDPALQAGLKCCQNTCVLLDFIAIRSV